MERPSSYKMLDIGYSGGNNVILIKKWGKKLFFGETKNITVSEIKFRRR